MSRNNDRFHIMFRPHGEDVQCKNVMAENAKTALFKTEISQERRTGRPLKELAVLVGSDHCNICGSRNLPIR